VLAAAHNIVVVLVMFGSVPDKVVPITLCAIGSRATRSGREPFRFLAHDDVRLP
jgi:hypothetical protein